MINTYIRTLVILVLMLSAALISVILWQSSEQKEVSRKTTDYHYASIHHLDEISKEILLIRNKIVAEKNRENSLSESNFNQSIYIINQNFDQVANLQKEFQSPEFPGLMKQLYEKLQVILPNGNPHRVLFNKEKPEVLSALDSLLLTVEQLVRLHSIANNKLFKRLDTQERDNLIVSALMVFFILFFVMVITRKTFLSVNKILIKQKRTENDLYNQKERIQITLESIGDAVISTDNSGIITYLNPVAEELTKWSSELAVGQSLTKIFNIVNEDTGKPSTEIVRRVLHEGLTVGLANHTILIARDGSQRAIEDSAAPIRDNKGKIKGIVVVFHDVTHARKMAQEMTWQASHDALTHLANRHKFESELSSLIDSATGPDHQHAFLYIDLDQFKVVNDTCGHIAGDELLKQVSTLLKAGVRDVDTVARLGGDEFGILLASCPIDKAKRIANQIRDAVHDFRFIWQEKVFTIGVSIGLVPITSSAKTISDIMSAADIACYAAKDIGGNRIHMFQEDDEALSLRQGEMEWVTRINHALEQDRFVLYQQSIISLLPGNNGEKRFEILLRMLDDDDKIISPMAFIPAAERYNLMVAIDRWVITHAFQQIASDIENKINFFSLNISGQTLGDDDFLNYVVQEIDKYAISTNKICFEITETAAITNFPQAIQFISSLKEKGCKFALDDFGSGLSSFGYLKNLPVDYLKIDGAFVQDMLENPIDLAMVESINNIGHLMNIKTIAEFVESQEIAERLRMLGIDYGQGYGLAKPVPLDQLNQQMPLTDIKDQR